MAFFNLSSLPQRKIVNYFKDLDIDIHENYLIKPNPIIVQKFYMDCLVIYKNKSYFNDTNNSSVLLNFIKEVIDFLSVIGLKNLSFKDIFNPNEKTFTIICSYIANFSMFRDSKKDIYDKAIEIYEKSIKEKNKLIVKKTELLNNIMTLRCKNNDNIKKNMHVMSQIKEIEEKLHEAKINQMKKIEDISKLKNEKINLLDNLYALEMIEHNLIQDVKKLNLQIISKPEDLIRIVDTMKITFDKEKDEIKNMIQSIRNKNDKVAINQKYLKKIKQIHQLATEYVKLNEEYDKLDQQTIIINSNIKHYESSIKSKEIKIAYIQKQINQFENKIETLDIKSKKFNDEINYKLVEIQNEHKKLADEKTNKENIKIQNNIEIQKYMSIKINEENNFVKSCNELFDLLIELKTKIELNKL